jgi:hypothetical protein
MIKLKQLRELIREILIKELGTFGATHPANDKKQKSSDNEEPDDSDQIPIDQEQN